MSQRTDATPVGGTPVLLVESDLFFLVNVRDTLSAAGYTVRVARRMAEIDRILGEHDGDQQPGEPPALVLVNAAARGIDWEAALALARRWGIPSIVYAPHVDVATQAAARAAGATRVIANSKLASDLPGVVARALQSPKSRPDMHAHATPDAVAHASPVAPTATSEHEDDIAAPSVAPIASTMSGPIAPPHDGADQQRSLRRTALDPPAATESEP